MITELPSKLIEMTRARRVIPFIGAGFSSSLNLPDWDGLLRKLAEDIDSPIPYDTVKTHCNGDNLQIAEYYLLISDGRVGPMRHAISNALQTNCNPLLSGPHVELVNLGAPQIYTTNFDESIEKAFRALKQPIELVSLPKHLATSSDAKTQVVKYHGDLRYDQTLVLTESNYYARLDLESPMDIKFRSDLLGRSVLFVGYSFRDINIRIIWFKLMRMMKDIPTEDRPTSFIVTFFPNPVLEKLYTAVGIETICLDPTGDAKTQSDRSNLLSDFMVRLVEAATANGHVIGHPNQPLFFGPAIHRAFFEAVNVEAKGVRRTRGRSRPLVLLGDIAKRQVSPCHQELVRQILLVEGVPVTNDFVIVALNYIKQFGKDPAATAICIRGLERENPRELLQKSNPDWRSIWGVKITSEAVDLFLRHFEQEISNHESPGAPIDHDLAYFVDVAKRILAAEIFGTQSPPLTARLEALLGRCSALYSAVSAYIPDPGCAPAVESITKQIDERIAQSPEPDPPF